MLLLGIGMVLVSLSDHCTHGGYSTILGHCIITSFAFVFTMYSVKQIETMIFSYLKAKS